MPGPKTNEIPGTRAVLRHSRQSAYKVREVLDLIRGKDVALAAEILRFSERDSAREVGKLLASAVANAENNDQLDPEELYVSTAYADEGPTIKRWRPRARGRAGRIRKRTCHVTVIVSRLPEDRLARMRARQAADLSERRARRVAGARRSQQAPAEDEWTAADVAEPPKTEDVVDDQAAVPTAEAVAPEVTEVEATEAQTTEAQTTEAQTTEAEAPAAVDETEVAPEAAPEPAPEAAAEESPEASAAPEAEAPGSEEAGETSEEGE